MISNFIIKLEKSKMNIQKLIPLRKDSIIFIFTSFYLILIFLVSIGIGLFSVVLSNIWTIINFPFFILSVFKVYTSSKD